MSDKDRIEKEAENIVNTYYLDKFTKRIGKEAEAYADSIDRRGCAFWQGMYRGYIAGATSERPKAWNEAIDAAIEKIQIKVKDSVATLDECIAVLEALKHKQP